MRRGSTRSKKSSRTLLAQKGIMFLVVCGQLEMEISQLDAEDAALFLEELG